MLYEVITVREIRHQPGDYRRRAPPVVLRMLHQGADDLGSQGDPFQYGREQELESIAVVPLPSSNLYCAASALGDFVCTTMPSITGVAQAGRGLGAFSTSTRHMRQFRNNFV